MAENLINWRKQDTERLKKAVNDFNKKIRNLEKQENTLNLPETISYKETKENIATRSEFNRKVQSLEKFMKAGAEDLKITKGGEGLTKWEWQELLNQKKIAKNRLTKELEALNKPMKTGYSRVQMGSERAREIEDTLESLEKLGTSKGASFTRLKARVQMLGQKDLEMKQAKNFRDNLLNELKGISKNNPEMKKLYEHLKNIKNPLEFYNQARKSDVLIDFKEWYLNPNDYGDFVSYDEIADYVLTDMEIDII